VIVADTSAIVTILRAEPEANLFAGVIGESDGCFLSALGLFEASMVMIGRGQSALAQGLDILIGELAIEIVPFDEEQARQSREAVVGFGKGRHPAALNFGDCIS
jgi:ribonuclease VapC